MNIITAVYNFLWGDLITLPLPGGSSIGISLLVLLLVPAGIYFTIRTRFVLIRRFPHMIQIAMEKNEHSQAGSISGFQALIVATATRVGMGNLVGVVAAISAGGAGAVFCCVLQISVRHIRVCWMQCQPERLQKRGFRNLSTESIV